MNDPDVNNDVETEEQKEGVSTRPTRIMNFDPDDPLVINGTAPYRVQRSIRIFYNKATDTDERQLLYVFKYRRFVSACGVIQLYVNDRFRKGKLARLGLPDYRWMQRGCYIHTPVVGYTQDAEGKDVPIFVKPSEDGVLRGRIEINLRMAQVCVPITSDVWKLYTGETRDKLSKEHPEILDMLEDPDLLDDGEFLDLPDDALNAFISNQFLSINVYPVDPGVHTEHEFAIDRAPRVEPGDIKNPASREQARYDQADTLKAMLVKYRKRGYLRHFGDPPDDDRNDCYIFIKSLGI